MPKNAQALVDEDKQIYAAERESRDLTTAELVEVKRLVERANEQHELEQQINSLGRSMGSSTPFSSTDPNASFAGGGPGDVFVASKAYRSIQRADQRPQKWSSEPVEVPLQMKGTLLETGAGGPGGGLIPPYYQPGAVSKLLEPVSGRRGSSNLRVVGGD